MTNRQNITLKYYVINYDNGAKICGYFINYDNVLNFAKNNCIGINFTIKEYKNENEYYNNL